MSASPETRPSLIVRLKNRTDDDAWFEFSEIYRPLIFRLACRRGLQPADADDLVQQVLSAVARVIDRWEDDPQRARFRTWLSRIANNAILNALTRRPHDRGTGDSSLHDLLDEHPAEGPDSDLIRVEHRREVFRWAARQVRPEFQPETWDAFWLTAVEERDVAEVAREQNRSSGSIYAVRSRVMRRLREKVAEWDNGVTADYDYSNHSPSPEL
jgi:RNA polymerase sigma-70 factor (ECF subfamily)